MLEQGDHFKHLDDNPTYIGRWNPAGTQRVSGRYPELRGLRALLLSRELRHPGTDKRLAGMVRPERFELPTFWFVARHRAMMPLFYHLLLPSILSGLPFCVESRSTPEVQGVGTKLRTYRLSRGRA